MSLLLELALAGSTFGHIPNDPRQLVRRVDPPKTLPQVRARPGGDDSEGSTRQHRHPNMRDAETQTLDTQPPHQDLLRLPMQDLLRLDVLRGWRRLPREVQIPIVREVYIFKLAEIYYAAHRRELEHWLENEAGQDWRQGHEFKNRVTYTHVANSAWGHFFASTRLHMTAVANIMERARAARPERIRHRPYLAQNMDVLHELFPHQRAIRAAADDSFRDALLSHAHIDGGPRFWEHMRAHLRGNSQFQEHLTSIFRALWHWSLDADDLRARLRPLVELEARRLLAHAHWTREDATMRAARELVRLAAPHIQRLDRSVRAGLAALQDTHGAATEAPGTAARVVALNYARARWPRTCAELRPDHQLRLMELVASTPSLPVPEILRLERPRPREATVLLPYHPL